MAFQENDAKPEITRDTHLVGFIRYDTSFGQDAQLRDVFKVQYKSKAPRVQTEDDWGRGEPEEGYLHVTGPMAEVANSKFRDSDAFIASGDKYVFTDDDGTQRVVFYADEIGHSARYTDYSVDRTRQNERRQAWRQEREARREQGTSEEPVREAAAVVEAQAAPSPSTDVAPAPPVASAPGFAASDAPMAPPPYGGTGAIAAREALMQNEQVYAAAPHAGHEAPSR